MEQNSVYVARGFLAESTEPTWYVQLALHCRAPRNQTGKN
jgi:hypothetical protein